MTAANRCHVRGCQGECQPEAWQAWQPGEPLYSRHLASVEAPRRIIELHPADEWANTWEDAAEWPVPKWRDSLQYCDCPETKCDRNCGDYRGDYGTVCKVCEWRH